MSLRNRVRATFQGVVALPGGPTCPICQDPVRPSHDDVELENDVVAHRRCARFAQSVGRRAQGRRA